MTGHAASRAECVLSICVKCLHLWLFLTPFCLFREDLKAGRFCQQLTRSRIHSIHHFSPFLDPAVQEGLIANGESLYPHL